ncbi:MAG: DUF503 domain-containing protein [Candidatus Latescibacterota bacterium]|nr:DUF503 domain-containing protein [Candidatus Latescibacterota bacterium]
MDVNVGESTSLKDKRRVIKSLKDRLKKNFNLALAEVGGLDEWHRAELAMVTVSNDMQHANSVISKAVNFVEHDIRVELVDYALERL